MNKSESIKNISEALVSAQAEMPAVKFNKVNPFLKNKYADLGAIIETAQPVLAKHGLAVSQLCTTEGESIGVETMLMHKSGEWISSRMDIPLGEERGKSTAQVAGSIVTYIRRYALASILGMYADEDGDGNGNEPAKPQPKRKPAPKDERPAVEYNADPMTIEKAYAVENSEGEKYGDLDTAKLSHMINAITKALTAEDLTDDKRQTYLMKQEAIKVILAARNSGEV
jgi:hypothetical protein